MRGRMTKLAAALAMSLSIAACRAPLSGLSQGSVLVYGVGHRDGSVSLSVEADGSAAYASRFPGHEDKNVHGKVTPEELRKLTDVLRQNDFCGLRSGRSTGVPDEARPSIAVRLEDLDCRVELWDNEFRENKRARECLRAVEDLASAIERRAEGTAQ